MRIALAVLVATIATSGYVKAAGSLDDCPSFKANKNLMIDMQKAASEAADRLTKVSEEDPIAWRNQLCIGIRLQTHTFDFEVETFKACGEFEGAAEQLGKIKDTRVGLSARSMQYDCSSD